MTYKGRYLVKNSYQNRGGMLMKKRIMESLLIVAVLEITLFGLLMNDLIRLNGFIVGSILVSFGSVLFIFSSNSFLPLSFLFMFKRLHGSRSDFTKRVDQRIQHDKSRNSKFYIFFLNIERIQWIHTSMGDRYDTRLFLAIVHRLIDLLSDQSIISRQSGDQIILLIPKTNKGDQYEKLAEQILEKLYQPYIIQGNEIYISCSIGISAFPEHSITAEGLISKAAFALYQAKESGRKHFYMYSMSDQSAVEDKMLMERELRKAIRDNQFEINFQPQISVETGNICGAEALLRWNHPDMGRISPAVFIPLAEEMGIISNLGEWVLKNATKRYKKWQEEGINLDTISVNISLEEFLNENLIHTVEQTLIESKIDPGRLKLEITESIAVNQVETVLQKLYQLKKLGVILALDDFGTGYSSLHYLSNFPIDYLKVDQSFIRPIKHEDEDAVITKSIIQMAKGLKLKVVAEGVETKEQFSFLKKIGCDEYQGYFYSPPLTAEEFKRVYKKKAKTPVQNSRNGRMLLV